MYIFIYFLLSFVIHAQTEIVDAKKSIQELVSTDGKFRVDKCEKINWDDLMLITKRTELKFEFKDGCDIKGVISPKLLNWFPIDLEVRNIPHYNRLIATGFISAILEQRPVIKLEIKDGTLLNEKSKLGFEGNYKVRPGLGLDKSLTKKLGGEVMITNLNGKKLPHPEKILIK